MSVSIVVPEVGESIVDARVAKWLKKEGDAVTAGEPLVELETDKVDVEVAAPQAGVLERIAHKDGEDVKIGEVLGTIRPRASADGLGEADSSRPTPGVVSPANAGPPVSAAGSGEADAMPPTPGVNPPATPSARKLAREQNVAIASVKSGGPRVTKADVAAASSAPPSSAPAPSPAASRPPAPSPAPSRGGAAVQMDGRETRVRMSKRRATIARRLVEAQQTAAMLTTFNEVDMSAVMALRERHKQSFKETHGVSLGIASFFVKAAVAALKAFERLNAEIQGDEMVIKHYYDIGIAVGADEGLVVPVLRDADRLSYADVERGIRNFATRAQDGTLTIEDLRGGTFSITNGGIYGSLMSTPILNPPQVGILGLHAIKERPVGVNGHIVLRPMMYIALTYDHRLVDGSEAVRFLVRIKELVEDPGGLLIES